MIAKLTNRINREALKKIYYLIISLLNSKYRKSLNSVKPRFVELNEKKTNDLSQILLKRYPSVSPLSPEQKRDLEDHMSNRLNAFRYRAIPWLNTLIPLEQCKVLEIGCGTGCATIALAEQGCVLTSIDVSDISIAKKGVRCVVYRQK